MEIKLNPCPFCTCRAVELEETTDGDGFLICAQVECPACLARGPQEVVLQNAIDFWNQCEVPPQLRPDVSGAKERSDG